MIAFFWNLGFVELLVILALIALVVVLVRRAAADRPPR